MFIKYKTPFSNKKISASHVAFQLNALEPLAKQPKMSDEVQETKEDTDKANGEEETKDEPKPAAPSEPEKAEEAKTAVPEPKKEPAKEVPSSAPAIAPESPAPAPVQQTAVASATATARTPPTAAPASTSTSSHSGLPHGYASSNPDAIVEEQGTVSALYVGRVIGKGGGTFWVQFQSRL